MSMANEVAVVDSSKFSALAGIAESGIDYKRLTYVKVPPRGTDEWRWEAPTGRKSRPALTGLAVVLTKQWQDLWPFKGKSTEGALPYMRSLDGKTAHIVGKDIGELDGKLIAAAKNADGSYDCDKLGSYFHWVNSPGGGGTPPQAQTTSVIGILLEGTSSPLLVRLPTTSCVAVQNWFADLEADPDGGPHYACVVSLTVKEVKGKSAPYNVVVPTFVRRIPDSEAAMVYESYSKIANEKLCGSIRPPRDEQASTDAVPF